MEGWTEMKCNANTRPDLIHMRDASAMMILSFTARLSIYLSVCLSVCLFLPKSKSSIPLPTACVWSQTQAKRSSPYTMKALLSHFETPTRYLVGTIWQMQMQMQMPSQGTRVGARVEYGLRMEFQG
ncbi:hypothetical protein EYC84_003535 [Monilinia fructicola]|uniref:Uncharacterized protein n=1 Tax=Monilinia fructicola TaxID=38448 RepID=A0A5M9JUV3_MONFR|nr:hypothetical protein EYC84_003535 [Monilinia fructicola]